jgi:hypothetical protein
MFQGLALGQEGLKLFIFCTFEAGSTGGGLFGTRVHHDSVGFLQLRGQGCSKAVDNSAGVVIKLMFHTSTTNILSAVVSLKVCQEGVFVSPYHCPHVMDFYGGGHLDPSLSQFTLFDGVGEGGIFDHGGMGGRD